MKTLGEIIKATRETSGLGRKKFAVRLGVSTRCLRRWEEGRFVPDLPHLKTLSKFVNSEIIQTLIEKRLAQKRKTPHQNRWNNLGDKIRAARINAGLSRKQVAEHLGFRPRTIGDWERGESAPQDDNLQKLTKFLKVPELPQYARIVMTQPRRDRLAETIRQARQAAGISQRKLARRMGVTHCSVCFWENGRVSISDQNLKKLAEILGELKLMEVLSNA